MAGIFQLAREPVFASEKERKFCMVVIDRVERSHATFWYYSSVVYWMGTVALAFFYNYDPLTTKVLTVGGVVALIVKIGNLVTAKSTRALRRGQLWGFFLSNLLMLVASRLHVTSGAHASLIAFWGLSSSFAFGVLSYRNYTHIVAMVFFFAVYGLGVQGYAQAELSFGFVTVLTFLISNAQIFSKRFIKIELMRSYRQQSIYTPKQVLQEAIETKSDVSSVFKPEMRNCVCICSDWRSFQAYASGVSAGELAGALEAYYNLQVQLLDKEFVEGNYFMDWIADELFVVGFETNTCLQEQLLNNACRYAIASLNSRSAFFDKHGAPVGVDVGISAGLTTVGMLGPDGNKKATALGQVPGLSRRLQTVGKSLRSTHGSFDRIVIAPQLLNEKQCESFGLHDVMLTAGLAVKDLNVQVVKVYCASNGISQEIAESTAVELVNDTSQLVA